MGTGMGGADAARRAAEHGSLDSMLFGMSRTTGDNVGAVRGKFIEMGVLAEDKDTGALSMPRGEEAFKATFQSFFGGKSSGKEKDDPESRDPAKRVAKIKAIDEELKLKPNANRVAELQFDRQKIMDAGGSTDLVNDAIVGIQTSGPIASAEFMKTRAAGKIPIIGKDGFMLPSDTFSRGDQDDMLGKIAIDDGKITRIISVNPGELAPVYAPTNVDPAKLSYDQLVVGGDPQKGFKRLHPTQAAAIVAKDFGSNNTGGRGFLGNVLEGITDAREVQNLGVGVERSEDDSDSSGSFIGMPKRFATKLLQASPLGALKPQDTGIQKWTRDFNRLLTQGGTKAAEAADDNPYKGMMKL
jgi:hypothetical protein